jgi:Nucleotidyl transferase AbiEii toxin, Type IV TA system
MSEPLAFKLDILPAAQRRLWDEGLHVPARFVLYGGTALGLRLGHRQSVDFDFFSADDFVPETLLRELPWGHRATLLQSEPNTLTLLDGGAEPVKLSFFGGLPFYPVKPPDLAPNGIAIASLEDLYATKLAAAVQRSEAKDYLDIAALIEHGIDLAHGLACARAFYGGHLNVALPLKALCYFEDGDLPSLPASIRLRLTQAVRAVTTIPSIPPSGMKIGPGGMGTS